MIRGFLFCAAALMIFSNAAFCIGETGNEKDIKKFYAAGEALYNKAQYAEAVKFYTAAVKLKDDFTDGWKKIGFCYYKTGNHKYAYYGFKKVLQYDKADKDALDFMELYDTMIAKEKKKNEKRNWGDPVWRSAIMPGWGQAHNNQFIKGIIFGAGYLVSGAMTAYSVVDENSKYKKYLAANENQEFAYKTAQDAYTQAIVWTGLTAAFWLGSMIDGGLNYNCEEARMLAAKPDIAGLVVACDILRVNF